MHTSFLTAVIRYITHFGPQRACRHGNALRRACRLATLSAILNTLFPPCVKAQDLIPLTKKINIPPHPPGIPAQLPPLLQTGAALFSFSWYFQPFFTIYRCFCYPIPNYRSFQTMFGLDKVKKASGHYNPLEKQRGTTLSPLVLAVSSPRGTAWLYVCCFRPLPNPPVVSRSRTALGKAPPTHPETRLRWPGSPAHKERGQRSFFHVPAVKHEQVKGMLL